MSKAGSQVRLEYVNRKSNLVAHKIAKYSRKELCSRVLQGQVPTCGSELVLHHCMNISIS
jgi:hypothetical protein